MPKLDYSKYTWCRRCEIKNELGAIFCIDCGKRTRWSAAITSNRVFRY